MLEITIPARELWDERKQEFIFTKAQTLRLEHSLVSISKWESKWCKPFFSRDEKTIEETIDYIKCMTLTQNVDPDIYSYLTQKNISDINHYIDAPMTATTFSNAQNKKASREIITSELVYYWMISLNIPIEFQKWHFNKLITLIKVCDIKNAPPKKMSRRETIDRHRALNQARRKRFG